MKKVINIAGNVYDVAKISAVYANTTNEYVSTQINGKFDNICEIHLIIDGADVTAYKCPRTEAQKIRNAIINVIAENSEIIEI